jgi:hypothetical protein
VRAYLSVQSRNEWAFSIILTKQLAGSRNDIGELVFIVNASAQGVTIGHAAGSENGMILRFAAKPVTGSAFVTWRN